jgi:hypothetical protein
MKSSTKNTSPTPAQQNVRNRFRDAARHAKLVISDPEQKHYYTQQARLQNLPNAYVAAVTEYLRTHPLIKITGDLKRITSTHLEKARTAQPKTRAVKIRKPDLIVPESVIECTTHTADFITGDRSFEYIAFHKRSGSYTAFRANNIEVTRIKTAIRLTKSGGAVLNTTIDF